MDNYLKHNKRCCYGDWTYSAIILFCFYFLGGLVGLNTPGTGDFLAGFGGAGFGGGVGLPGGLGRLGGFLDMR